MKKAIIRAILTLYLLASALQTVRILYAVREPGEIDYGEGVILWQASQVFHLKSAFRPLEQYPHMAFMYTPVYHIALRIVAAVAEDPLVSGRLVSMAAAFWLVGLFAWVVFRSTRGYATAGARRFGAVFAGACVLLPPTMQWVPFARVDILGVALAFTGLSMILAEPLRLRNQVAAVCLLLLALYTRQSLVAIPAASILLLALVRPAAAARFFSVLTVSGAGVLAILSWATDGGVIRSWFLYVANRFSLGEAVRLETQYSANLAPLLAAGFAAAWLTLPRPAGSEWRKKLSARLARSRLRRTGIGLGLAALLGFITSWGVGKEGASLNYCLEWQLALCPLAGLFVVLCSRVLHRGAYGMVFLRPVLAVLLGTGGLLFGLQALKDCNDTTGWFGYGRQLLLQKRRDDAELARLIAKFPGPVVSINMTALLRAGKSIPFEPVIVKLNADSGVFDETPLVRRTSDRFFDAFILPNIAVSGELRYFTERMLQAIHQNYQLYPADFGAYAVYVPRRPPARQ